jgi:serine/threonine protein kinase
MELAAAFPAPCLRPNSAHHPCLPRPQIIRGEAYGRPVDWWCLGTVLYEMLCGLPPFYTKQYKLMYRRILEEPLKFPSYVPEDARDLISKLLDRNVRHCCRIASTPVLQLSTEVLF